MRLINGAWYARLAAVSIALLAAGCGSSLRASYPCARAEQPPVLDGDLSDPCWARAEVAVLDQPVNGLLQAKARTVFRLLWDDAYLYFSAAVQDATPLCVGAARDDHVWEGDCFELFLNPDNRPGEYYEMDFNSSGVIWDSLWLRHSSGGSRILRSWTAPSLECRTKPQPGGWTLEGRVRLDEFVGAAHLPPAHGDRWRFNAHYLDARPSATGQEVFSWAPTTNPNDTCQFGEILFRDPAGIEAHKRQQSLAVRLLRDGTTTRADSLADRVETLTVRSQMGAVFHRVAQPDGWSLAPGFGRFVRRVAVKGEPPGLFAARPAAETDPTLVDFTVWEDGTLLLIGKLDAPAAQAVAKGQADGVTVQAMVAGAPARNLRLNGDDWLAEGLPVHRGQTVRLQVDAGPAGNIAWDFAFLGVFLVKGDVQESSDLPAGWELIGDAGHVRVEPSSRATGGSSIRVEAADCLSGVCRWVPRAQSEKLYRITGWVRSDLAGVTRAHVGVDYCSSQKAFLRQACTWAPLTGHLRWGLYNLSGRAEWQRFAAYAYDVPPDTAWLRLWCGVNAWETPGASGSACFEDVRIESITPDPAWPLGFPPARWQSERALACAAEIRDSGYCVSSASCVEYILPESVSAHAADSRPLAAFSLPGWKEPLSFTIYPRRDLTAVRIQVSDLAMAGATGGRISAGQVEVRRVRSIYKRRDLMSNEYLLSPNHLETFESLDIPANHIQQFWLTVQVPSDAPPGQYSGQVVVEPANGPAKTLRLTLEVLPVRLETPRGVTLGLYSYHLKRDTKATLFAALLDMKDHGMTTTFMFNPGLNIPIENSPTGKPRIIWNEANQLGELFDTYKEAGFTEPLYLIAPSALFKAAESRGGPCGTEGFASVYRDLWAQVLTEKTRRNWLAFVVAPYDEGYPYPFTDQRFAVTRSCGSVLKELAIPIALHALNHPTPGAIQFEREFYSLADSILLTFCHPPVCVTESYRGFENWNAYRARVRRDGKKLLFYNIDTTGVHPEAMRFGYGAALWNRKADGLMDWHYQESQRDGGYGISSQAGSAVMNFTYPPTGDFRGGPSIGWEATREGTKDYALLYTLRALANRAERSPDAALRKEAAAAWQEVEALLDRLTFSTIDTTGALSLPSRWTSERWTEDGVKLLGGEFKVPNGWSLADYGRLRRMLCDRILLLQDRIGG